MVGEGERNGRGTEEPATAMPPAEPGSPGGPAPRAGSGQVAARGNELPVPLARRFARELAAQLFQRWEVALREQFEAELRLRVRSELRHREETGRPLRAEVAERRARKRDPWNRRYGPYGHATFEMEQALVRQSADLAEVERRMGEIRARLREMEAGRAGDATPAPQGGESKPAGRDTRADESEAVGERVPDDATAKRAGGAATGGAELALKAEDLDALAATLSTELFQPWESTLRRRFQEEIGERLEEELIHREQQAADLREEVEERQAMWEGMWSAQHPRGTATDTERWEAERRLLRQSAELAANERAVRELRERLLELGEETGGPVIIDAGPATAGPPAPDAPAPDVTERR